jgi:hypothetical protein
VVALVADARPVRVLASPVRRFGRWLLVAIATAWATTLAIGVRPDLGAMFARGPLAREFVLVALAAAIAGWAAFVSSVPGARGARVGYVAAIGAGVAWAVAVGARLALDGALWTAIVTEPAHAACPLRIAVAAAVPGTAAWLMIRRAAPLARRRSATLAALSALAAGAAAVQCMCPFDGAAHILLWHVAPVALGVGAAGLMKAQG